MNVSLKFLSFVFKFNFVKRKRRNYAKKTSVFPLNTE